MNYKENIGLVGKSYPDIAEDIASKKRILH